MCTENQRKERGTQQTNTHTQKIKSMMYIFHSKSITNAKFMDKPIYKRMEMDHILFIHT